MKASKIVLVMLVAMTFACGVVFAQAGKGSGAYDKLYGYLKGYLELEYGKGKVMDDMVIAYLARNTAIYIDAKNAAGRTVAKKIVFTLQKVDRGELDKNSPEFVNVKKAINYLYGDFYKAKDITLKQTAWLIWADPRLTSRICDKAGVPCSVNELKLSGFILNPEGPTWKNAQEKILGEMKMKGGTDAAGELGIAGGGGTGGGSEGGGPSVPTPGGGGGGGTTADCVGEAVQGDIKSTGYASSFPTDGGGQTAEATNFGAMQKSKLPCDEPAKKMDVSGSVSAPGDSPHGKSEKEWKGKGGKNPQDWSVEAHYTNDEGKTVDYFENYSINKGGKTATWTQKVVIDGQTTSQSGSTTVKHDPKASEKQFQEAKESAEETAEAAGGVALSNPPASAAPPATEYNPEASGDPCGEIADALGGNCSGGCGDDAAAVMASILGGASASKGGSVPIDYESPEAQMGAESDDDCGPSGGEMKDVQEYISLWSPEGGGPEGGKSDPCAKEKTGSKKKEQCCQENQDSASCKGGGGPDPAPQMMKGKMDKQGQVKDPGKMKGGAAGVKTDTKMKGPGGAAGKGKK